MAKHNKIIETFSVDLDNLVLGARDLLEDLAQDKPVLTIDFEATHSGRLTNNRVYPGVHMQASVDTFLKPTPRPVLKNHSRDSDPIGRVTGAKFVKLKDGKQFLEDFKRPSKGRGSGFIQLTADIMDEGAIELFLDGRFKEFSTSQKMDAFLCSFCGNDFAKGGYCGHYPGDTVLVEGKKEDKEIFVYGITGPLKYLEVSTVSVPGDSFTNILEMKMAKDSDDDTFTLESRDDELHDISSLVLRNSSNDSDSVDLLCSGDRQEVTAKDRQILTKKTIFSVTGPGFAQNVKELEMVDKSKVSSEEEVQDEVEKTEDKNTSTDTTSESTSESSQETDSGDKGEDVVVPEVADESTNDETNTEVSDEEIANASLEALVISNRGLKAESTRLRSEVGRLKGEITGKDEEIDRLRTSVTESQSAMKEQSARQLLDTRIMLKKADVADIKDSDAYKAKLTDFSSRSADSLTDALADLSVEVAQLQDGLGITQIAEDTEVTSPVSNTPEKPTATEEPKTQRKTRTEILDEVV